MYVDIFFQLEGFIPKAAHANTEWFNDYLKRQTAHGILYSIIGGSFRTAHK